MLLMSYLKFLKSHSSLLDVSRRSVEGVGSLKLKLIGCGCSPSGPLLLSVKGIIDLAQMPPTILLPHPGGTVSPSLDRITYIPGPQTPFPPRAFNPASISPGEDPTPPLLSNTWTSPSSPGGGALETRPSLLLWDQFCCFNLGSFFQLKLTTAVFCTTIVAMRCY